jgi:LPXTG-site transpeptidase (sortase) family protein
MTMDEYFTKDKFGKLQNKTPDETDKVLQPMLLNGAIHLPFTVKPGKIGNSYIIGNKNLNIYGNRHYNEIVNLNYATAFKDLDQAKVGQLFYIYDAKGKKLAFKVFEIAEVKSTDTDQAYKQFDKPVVTLQTFAYSNFSSESNEITDTYLLVRGELQK